jgi:hypothetical protein
MAVTHTATLKSQRMQLVADRIDGKTPAASTGSATAGQLVIGTSALSGATGVLATIALAAPGFTESGGVLTMAGAPRSGVASASGTAAKAELRTNAGATITSGLTVGVAGSDVILGSTAITSGATVAVTSGTLTHA